GGGGGYTSPEVIKTSSSPEPETCDCTWSDCYPSGTRSAICTQVNDCVLPDVLTQDCTYVAPENTASGNNEPAGSNEEAPAEEDAANEGAGNLLTGQVTGGAEGKGVAAKYWWILVIVLVALGLTIFFVSRRKK
ncbi:MAG: hypothetical protein ACP5N3_00845, partial [Candidatus Nanoarchaeia archaeon]